MDLMTTEPLEPLDEEPDQDVGERYPDDDDSPEVPNEDAQDPDPAIPPPEPTNG